MYIISCIRFVAWQLFRIVTTEFSKQVDRTIFRNKNATYILSVEQLNILVVATIHYLSKNGDNNILNKKLKYIQKRKTCIQFSFPGVLVSKITQLISNHNQSNTFRKLPWKSKFMFGPYMLTECSI